MRIIFLSFIIVIIDQISKFSVRSYMVLYQSEPVIPNFFHLTYVTNKGMAFGINFPGGIYIFTALSLIMTGFLIWYLYQERSNHILLRISLSFILAGAVGNLIDRIFYQEVVDFLDFMIGDYHWYIFNIADSAVTVGISIYIYYSLLIESRKKLKTSTV